jgi:hypothetical protein
VKVRGGKGVLNGAPFLFLARQGAGPSLMFLARTSAKEAAPALPVLQSWAPRTPASPVVSPDLPDLQLRLQAGDACALSAKRRDCRAFNNFHRPTVTSDLAPKLKSRNHGRGRDGWQKPIRRARKSFAV